jgi:BMFP domain-containing protein YqiC
MVHGTYINTNEESYQIFVRNREEKKNLEKRIDRLEILLSDMIERISKLEDSRKDTIN